MEFENLWSILANEESENLTSNIKELLRQESAYLKNQTKGLVCGKFRIIKRTRSIAAITSMMDAVLATPEVEDDDTKGLINANELYEEKRYCYEIYNKSYKFRLFEMMLSPVYPVKLMPEDGIWEDEERVLLSLVSISDKNKYELQIDSDEMLMDVLRAIFQSKKVQFIIRRMIETTTISS